MKLQLNLLEREEDRLEVGLDPQAQGTSIPEWKYSNWEEDGYKDSNYNSMLGIGSNEMKRKWNFFFDPFPPFRIRVAVRFRQILCQRSIWVAPISRKWLVELQIHT